MPDDSLIDEMRAAIRGDRERAEERRRGAASTVAAEVPEPPEELPAPEPPQQTPVDAPPEPEPARVGWWRRVFRRGNP